MTRPTLQGQHILVVEDEPLIALDIALAFEQAGAQVATATTLAQALLAAEGNLSAAVIDHGLGDGDSFPLYRRLKTRRIPFMVYSGFAKTDGLSAPHLPKPATHEALVSAMVGLLRAGVPA